MIHIVEIATARHRKKWGRHLFPDRKTSQSPFFGIAALRPQ